MILTTHRSKICRVGWQNGDPGNPVLQFQSEGKQVEDPGEPMFQFESKDSLL